LPFFVFHLLFGFRSGFNRASTMTQKVFASFDDSFGSVPKLIRLFIQVLKALFAALAKRFTIFLSRQQRDDQPADGPEPQAYEQEEQFAVIVDSHALPPLFGYARTDLNSL